MESVCVKQHSECVVPKLHAFRSSVGGSEQRRFLDAREAAGWASNDSRAVSDRSCEDLTSGFSAARNSTGSLTWGRPLFGVQLFGLASAVTLQSEFTFQDLDYYLAARQDLLPFYSYTLLHTPTQTHTHIRNVYVFKKKPRTNDLGVQVGFDHLPTSNSTTPKIKVMKKHCKHCTHNCTSALISVSGSMCVYI